MRRSNKEGKMTEKTIGMVKDIDEAIETQKKRIAMAVKDEVALNKLDNSTGSEIDLLTSLVASKMELLARIAGSPINPLANDQSKGMFAVAKSLDNVASAIRALGTNDAGTKMGAMEYLAVSIKDGLDTIAKAVEEKE
jgi:hypothetical protein